MSGENTVLIIDHEDSYVHTIARYVGLCGQPRLILRHNETSIDAIQTINPSHIILSPGPCSPQETKITIPLIHAMGPTTPILGICLGHQAIGAAFRAPITRCTPCHGKTSDIYHDGSSPLLSGLPVPFKAARYHSLHIGTIDDTPLIQTAHTADGLIMGVQHHTYPIYGLQFHPESCLTVSGLRIIENFILSNR